MEFLDIYFQDHQRIMFVWVTPDEHIFLTEAAANEYAQPLNLPVTYIDRIAYATEQAVFNGRDALTYGKTNF